MVRLNRISIALLVASALTIIAVLPSYKKEMQINDLARRFEAHISLMSAGGFLLIGNCGQHLNLINTGVSKSNATHKAMTRAERDRCRENRKKNKNLLEEWYSQVLARDGCFDEFDNKHNKDFTSAQILKACDIAIERVKKSDRHKRKYDPRN